MSKEENKRRVWQTNSLANGPFETEELKVISGKRVATCKERVRKDDSAGT